MQSQRNLRARLVACAAALLAFCFGVTGALPSAADSTVPASKALPDQMDLTQEYQGQSMCNPPPKPGISALQELLTRTYGNHPIYTSRSCSSDPNSEHTEGRALDWMVSLRRPSERAKAEAFLGWLLAPDTDGTPAAMARRMGIMYIGWNSQIWRGYRGARWGELKGCFSKTSTAWDTYCHRDHIHFSMTWDGAAGRSSYWSGQPQTIPACPVTQARGRKAPVARSTRWVWLPRPRIVIDTATGYGNWARPCRLQESRWSGDTQQMSVSLTGVKGMLPANTQRVIVQITTRLPNAPSGMYVWPTGESQGRIAFYARMNENRVVRLARRLGASGSISLATETGNVPFRVEIIRYELPK